MATEQVETAESGSVSAPKPRGLENVLRQMGWLLVIGGPLILTFYAAVVLTHGKVAWGYPVAALAAAAFANLGTTAGYHRMLTHQAFTAHPVVQYGLLILGAVAGMGSPVYWAQDHLHHHSHSDTAHDLHSPHTPLYRGRRFEGLWKLLDAHMGWMFRSHDVKVSAKGQQITQMPAAQFVHRTALLWLLAGLLLPLCFGWNAFLWVGVVRLFLNHHITWSVNSICHLWGRQPFKNTRDNSKNNAIVGILALGEGWHNNHHFRPSSARHGLLRGQLDLTYAVICLLERCRLVGAVKRYAPCRDCHDWFSTERGGSASCARCRQLAQAA